MKRFFKSKKLIILILLIILLIGLLIINNRELINNIIGIEIEKEEAEPFFSYIVYDNQDEQNIKVLITISTENGVDYIEKENNTKIYGNGKSKIVIDDSVKKDEEQTLKIKENGKELVEEKILVNDEKIENTVKIEKISDNEGYKTIGISNNIDLDGFETYYQIGKNGDWVQGDGKISILDYDVTTNNLINEDDTVTISAMAKNDTTGAVFITISKDFDIDTTSTLSSFEADSLLNAMEKYDFGTGKFKVTVEDETYSLKVYSFEENLEIQADTTFGTEEDVATDSEYAQNMVVLKVNGDLTINEGATLTSYASKNGYGGPKGMMIYCTGTLTNNGTISMTARGAYAEGQNVYLWKNLDGSYEYVPAVGASGGDSFTIYYSSRNGNAGKNGINRSLGGGGTGAANGYTSTITIFEGGTATSYSGGAGQGAQVARMTGTKASNIGGTGGSFTTYGNNAVGGGAGNPGGQGYNNSTLISSYKGSNGTGGLLTIYANKFINNASITSDGSTGGIASYGGGSSGGGSINIFYSELYENVGNYSVEGGTSVGTRYKSGAGGTGTVSIGKIYEGTCIHETGNYVYAYLGETKLNTIPTSNENYVYMGYTSTDENATLTWNSDTYNYTVDNLTQEMTEFNIFFEERDKLSVLLNLLDITEEYNSIEDFYQDNLETVMQSQIAYNYIVDSNGELLSKLFSKLQENIDNYQYATTLSYEGTVDGTNNTTISLSPGIYAMKLSCNYTYSIQNVLADNIEIQEVDTDTYLFSIKNTLSIEWYCNMRGYHKYLYIQYDRLGPLD